MKMSLKKSIPMQTPSHNGHCIGLKEVITNAIAIQGLTAQTFLELHTRFAQHHEAAFVFAKIAGAAAEHEAELQRRWARAKTTPRPIALLIVLSAHYKRPCLKNSAALL